MKDLWFFDMTTNRWTRVKQPTDESGAGPEPVRPQAAQRVPRHTNLPHARTQTSVLSSAGSSLVQTQGTKMSSTMSSVKSVKENWPRARYLHTAVVYNDGMFVYGGWMTDWSKEEHVWRLDLTSLTWTELEVSKPSTVPDRRFGHIAAVWDHRMHLFGGNRSTKTTNELWSFDLVHRRWTQIESNGPKPAPRKWFVAVTFHWYWVYLGWWREPCSNCLICKAPT